MDLLTYVNSYYNCAINNVPTAVLEEWRLLYPQLGIARPLDYHNVRFLDGRYISYYSMPYISGEPHIGGNLDCVSEYLMLYDDAIDDVEIDCNSIL